MAIGADVLTVDQQMQQLLLLALFSLSKTSIDITSFEPHYESTKQAGQRILSPPFIKFIF